MRYSRSEACAIAGMDEGRFGVLFFRQQLPPSEAEQRDRIRRLRTFCARDTLHLATIRTFLARIAGEPALRPRLALMAAGLVRTFVEMAFECPRGQTDIWGGIAACGLDQSGDLPVVFPLGGTLGDVAAQVGREQPQSEHSVDFLMLVNASAIVRQAQARAKGADIWFPETAAADRA